MKFKSFISAILVVTMAMISITACSNSDASNTSNNRETDEEYIEETSEETRQTLPEYEVVTELFMESTDGALYSDDSIYIRFYGIAYDSTESYGVESRYTVSYMVENSNDFPIGFYVDTLIIDNFEFEIERYIYVDANSETWVDVPLLTYALRHYTEYSPTNVYMMQLHSYCVNEDTGEMIVDPDWISFETTNGDELHVEDEGIDFDNGIIVYDEDGVVIHCVDLLTFAGSSNRTYYYFIIENNTESVVDVSAVGAIINGSENPDATFDVSCEPGFDTITYFVTEDIVVNDVVVHFVVQNDSDSEITFDTETLTPSMFE